MKNIVLFHIARQSNISQFGTHLWKTDWNTNKILPETEVLINCWSHWDLPWLRSPGPAALV